MVAGVVLGIPVGGGSLIAVMALPTSAGTQSKALLDRDLVVDFKEELESDLRHNPKINSPDYHNHSPGTAFLRTASWVYVIKTQEH